ncbi:epoxyqueuosine reductase QueH [bacterium]|nr:epoxyqueuosine reductase QueH [bacterium]MBU1754019.1 epoxyqueuosine reductase QueH [bacterium]
MKKIVLLHICCGVCASSVVERLRSDGFEVVGFFYNPNIYPSQEYQRRLDTVAVVAKHLNLQLIEGEYDPHHWLSLTKGMEKEPEAGARCEVCFQMRLEEAYRKSMELSVPYFTTTLTVSSHKDALIINRIGSEIDDKAFLLYDFKKQNGFKKAMEFSRQHLLYRQQYCGCVYGMKLQVEG